MNSKETQMQQGLTQLRTRLLVMAAAVGIAVDEACAALATGNTGRAIAVVDGDASINLMENEIDEMALSLLVRNQPVAQDLRMVVGALRMVIDLERIGDEAANIAERAMVLQEKLPEEVMRAVKELMETAGDAYRKAIAAFRNEDAATALAIIENETECAQKEVKVLHHIMDDFCSGGASGYNGHNGQSEQSAKSGQTGQGGQSEHAEQNSRGGRNGKSQMGMHGILISRSLSRICRRSANIAEHVYFIAKGVNIKHSPLPER